MRVVPPIRLAIAEQAGVVSVICDDPNRIAGNSVRMATVPAVVSCSQLAVNGTGSFVEPVVVPQAVNDSPVLLRRKSGVAGWLGCRPGQAVIVFDLPQALCGLVEGTAVFGAGFGAVPKHKNHVRQHCGVGEFIVV